MRFSWLNLSALVLLIAYANGQVAEEEVTTIVPGNPDSETELSKNLTTFTINEPRREIGENGSAYRPIVEKEVGYYKINMTSATKKAIIEELMEESQRVYEDEEEKLEEEEEKADDDESEEEEENKFISKSSEISFEHIEFVQLRLKHLALSTPNDITELRKVQEEEFKENYLYKEAWTMALKEFNKSKKELFKGLSNNSIAVTVPIDYHIAIIAYSLQNPTMYAKFNQETREICSGNNIEKYRYKSFFKLLLLAVQTLGKEKKFISQRRFLYRGAGLPFGIKIDQVLAFQQFTSTSSSLKVAEGFTDNFTLFEMDGPFYGTTMSIKHHSLYDEEEVLFSPLQVYIVDSSHLGSHYNRVVLKPFDFKMEGKTCGFEPETPKEEMTTSTTTRYVSTTKVPTNKATRRGKQLNQKNGSDNLSLNIALIAITTTIHVLLKN